MVSRTKDLEKNLVWLDTRWRLSSLSKYPFFEREFILTEPISKKYQFFKKVEYLKSELSFQLSILRDKFGEIIIFGAGHRATMFINLLGISDLVSLVIDDDPNKNSLKIPLAGIEIKSSEEINWNNIGVCIFAISLNAEEKVKKVLEKKIKNKIKFYSISPDSQYSLPIFSVF